MPDELKRAVAWLWVSLVTAYASVVPLTRPKPGAKRTPRTRARAVRTGRSVIRDTWGAWKTMGDSPPVHDKGPGEMVPQFYARRQRASCNGRVNRWRASQQPAR